MTTLLHTTALIALFTVFSSVPAMAADLPVVSPIDADVTDSCVRKSRRPIAEVVSGRCTETEDEAPHYFAQTLPECDCLLEQDEDGLFVLRLSLPVQALPQAAQARTPAVPAVFRRQLADASQAAHIL